MAGPSAQRGDYSQLLEAVAAIAEDLGALSALLDAAEHDMRRFVEALRVANVIPDALMQEQAAALQATAALVAGSLRWHGSETGHLLAVLAPTRVVARDFNRLFELGALSGIGGRPLFHEQVAEDQARALEQVPDLQQSELGREVRNRLLEDLTPSLSEFDPVPRGSVEQARRFSELKRSLLELGAFTYEALAEAWRKERATARKRVARWVERHQVFTVTHDGETLIPAVLLRTPELEPRPELQIVLAAMNEAREDGWSIWSWLVNPSPWLDGAIPSELARERPEAVESAVRARTATMA